MIKQYLIDLDPKFLAKQLWLNTTIRSIISTHCPEDEFGHEADTIKKLLVERSAFFYDNDYEINIKIMATILRIGFQLSFLDILSLVPPENDPCWTKVARNIMPYDM